MKTYLLIHLLYEKAVQYFIHLNQLLRAINFTDFIRNETFLWSVFIVTHKSGSGFYKQQKLASYSKLGYTIRKFELYRKVCDVILVCPTTKGSTSSYLTSFCRRPYYLEPEAFKLTITIKCEVKFLKILVPWKPIGKKLC